MPRAEHSGACLVHKLLFFSPRDSAEHAAGLVARLGAVLRVQAIVFVRVRSPWLRLAPAAATPAHPALRPGCYSVRRGGGDGLSHHGLPAMWPVDRKLEQRPMLWSAAAARLHASRRSARSRPPNLQRVTSTPAMRPIPCTARSQSTLRYSLVRRTSSCRLATSRPARGAALSRAMMIGSISRHSWSRSCTNGKLAGRGSYVSE